MSYTGLRSRNVMIKQQVIFEKKKIFPRLRVIVHVIIHSNASSDDAAFVYFVEYVSMSCSVDDAYL